jgi:anhydro-N-acetylmuramic acid kinase
VTPSPAPTRLAVGCMTGTSIDALDAALVRITGHGLDLRIELLGARTHPLGPVALSLRALAEQTPMTASDIAGAARLFSMLHAEAVAALLVDAPSSVPPRPDLICVHGQTVAHRPPVSWQLFNPWPLVRALGAPVVFDLRGADLAGGGQGAPITPIADWMLLRGERPRAVVNLGGFCNVTLLPGYAGTLEAVRALDVCACNQVLDAVARRRLGAPFDDRGARALAGKAVGAVVEALSAALAGQSRSGRSLGTGDELAKHPALEDPGVSPEDAARSACRAVASTLVASCSGASELVLAGGGVQNGALMEEIGRAASARGQTVVVSDSLGVPAAYREAVAFAVLGALCRDRVPVTLPRVTGVSPPAPLAGCWAGV